MSSDTPRHHKRSDAQVYRATCPGCGDTLTDPSERWVRAKADEHEDDCDDLEDQEVAVDAVNPEVLDA